MPKLYNSYSRARMALREPVVTAKELITILAFERQGHLFPALAADSCDRSAGLFWSWPAF